MSIKVAFFTQNVVFDTFSSVIAGWSHALAAHGVEDIDIVSIIGNPAEFSYAEFPEQARHVVLPGGRTARALLPLRRYLLREAPDVLITAAVNINIVAILATLVSRWHGKLILTHHHPIALSHATTWKDNKYGAKLLYRFAHGSFAVGPDILEDAIRECHLDRSTAVCIPNVLRPRGDFQETGDPHPWLSPQADHGPVFVTVSRLVAVKNFPLLLEAFQRVADRIDGRLLIIGKGEEESSIRRLIVQEKLENRVELLGFVDSTRPFLRKAWAFVLASNEEGFSQVLAEAMYEGLPVISTDADGGGPRYVLQGGQYGLLVRKGDTDELASAMLSMADPDVRAKFCLRGPERAKDFSPEAVGSKLHRFIEKVVGARKAN